MCHILISCWFMAFYRNIFTSTLAAAFSMVLFWTTSSNNVPCYTKKASVEQWAFFLSVSNPCSKKWAFPCTCHFFVVPLQPVLDWNAASVLQDVKREDKHYNKIIWEYRFSTEIVPSFPNEFRNLRLVFLCLSLHQNSKNIEGRGWQGDGVTPFS